VYIGGGTPSAVSVDGLYGFLRDIEHTLEGRIKEWTMEVNPESLGPDLLDMLRSTPVDRLSLGIQAAAPNLLSLLDRNARLEDIHRAADLLEERWEGRISIDLMYGIPGQTEEDVRRGLDMVDLFETEHVSLYGLTVEPGTPLAERRLPLNDEEDIRVWRLFDAGLEERNFSRYEISNYARREGKGKSLHNLKYWRYEPYLGCGPGAHSTLHTGDGTLRIENPADLGIYLDRNTTDFGASRGLLTERERMLEFLLMGFRLTRGIDHARFERFFRRDFRECFREFLFEWMSDGLAITDDDRTAFTERGIWIMNTLLVRLAGRVDQILPA
jgi:oxygen-independent coproporphyrinogen-3 oxidase